MSLCLEHQKTCAMTDRSFPKRERNVLTASRILGLRKEAKYVLLIDVLMVLSGSTVHANHAHLAKVQTIGEESAFVNESV